MDHKATQQAIDSTIEADITTDTSSSTATVVDSAVELTNDHPVTRDSINASSVSSNTNSDDLAQTTYDSLLESIETLVINAATEELSQLLKIELKLAYQLQFLMQKEYQAIEQQQLKYLEELTTDKANILTQLQQDAHNRLQWMQDHGLPITSHCLSTPPLRDCPQCQALWHALADIYQDNRQQSNRLADIVLTLKRRTQRKLDLLSGKPSDAMLYNPSGTTHSQPTGRGGIKV